MPALLSQQLLQGTLFSSVLVHPSPPLQLPQPDTLFYIFYGMPGDEAQLYAADELAAR